VVEELMSDMSLIADEQKTHPAWPAFVESMQGRAYGRGPLNSAWAFFRRGWDAREPSAPPPIDTEAGGTERG